MISLLRQHMSKCFYKTEFPTIFYWTISFKNIIFNKVKILNTKKSLKTLLNEPKSLSRFGDGEFNIIFNSDINFQKFNNELRQRLMEILKNSNKNCYIGIPYLLNDGRHLTNRASKFWFSYINNKKKSLIKLLNLNSIYLDASLTRVYIDYKDKSKAKDYFNNLKRLWYKKDLLIVEGKTSCLGFNNDLFNEANSIRRIICPDKNAYDIYDVILKTITKYGKNKLIIISLGPTATVLAYDLSLENYTALDLGNIDIEYEWYLRKAKHKMPIEGKYSNEIHEKQNKLYTSNKKYLNEIICELKNKN